MQQKKKKNPSRKCQWKNNKQLEKGACRPALGPCFLALLMWSDCIPGQKLAEGTQSEELHVTGPHNQRQSLSRETLQVREGKRV